MAARPRNLFWYRFCEEKKKERIVFTVWFMFQWCQSLWKLVHWNEKARKEHLAPQKRDTEKFSRQQRLLLQLLLLNSYHKKKCKSKPYTTEPSCNWQCVRESIVASFLQVNMRIQTPTPWLSIRWRAVLFQHQEVAFPYLTHGVNLPSYPCYICRGIFCHRELIPFGGVVNNE